MRVALLTADPALWSVVSKTAQSHPGFLVDLCLLRCVLAKRGAALACDVLIVDLRYPYSDWVWALRLPRSLPTLVVVAPDTPPSLKRRLSSDARHDLTFIDSAASQLLPKVRRFIGLHSAPLEWHARFDDYTLSMPGRTVEIAGQGMLRLSEHKFRFVLNLFLHCRTTLHWSVLQRLAWGKDVPVRSSAVAAHASWAQSILELDGRHGYELVIGDSRYHLRRRGTQQKARIPKYPEASDSAGNTTCAGGEDE